MKKIYVFCALSFFFLLLSPKVSLALDTRVTSALGYPGDQDVSVSVTVAGLSTIGLQEVYGVDLVLTYNPTQLNISSSADIHKGSLLPSEWETTINVNTPGTARITLWHNPPSGSNTSDQVLPSQSGTVASIDFNVPSTATPGQQSIQLTEARFGTHLATASEKLNGIFIIRETQSANNPPVLTAIGNKTIQASSTLTFNISATDPDGGTLTYSASNLPTGATFTGQTFNWTPTATQVGAHTGAHFEVEDSASATDSENITIMVSAAAPVTYTIVATTSSGGSIFPSGNVSVTAGNNQNFSITANQGYYITTILKDDLGIGLQGGYPATRVEGFDNVNEPHIISASFAIIPTYTISTSFVPAGGGSITPAGSLTVQQGQDQLFTITANIGYYISSITADGASLPLTRQSMPTTFTHSFDNVTANHTLSAVFETTPASTYTISASVSTLSGGTITPQGHVIVAKNADQSFDIQANPGYYIASIAVDGSNIIFLPGSALLRATYPYTFQNVTANHKIVATFAVSSATSHTIEASITPAGSGIIEPSGNVTVDDGDYKVFTVTAQIGYFIDKILVDGSEITIISDNPYPTNYAYTFPSVTGDHRIQAQFAAQIKPDSISLNVADAQGAVGQTNIPVGISLSGVDQASIYGINLTIQYDSTVLKTPTSIVKVTLGSDWLYNVSSPNVNSATGIASVDFVIYSDNLPLTTDGEFISIPFSVQDTVPYGKTGSMLNISAAKFNGLTVPQSSIDNGTFTVTNATSITYILTITNANMAGGFTTPAEGIHTYNENQSVSISATANSGYGFSQWQIGSATSSDNPLSVTMNSDKSVNAVFALDSASPVEYDIVVTIQPTGGGTNPGTVNTGDSLKITEGTSRTCTVVPNAGYEIDEVILNNQSLGAVATFQLQNVSSNQNITAIFTPLLIVTNPSDFDPSLYEEYPYYVPMYGTVTINAQGLATGEWVGVYNEEGDIYGAGQYQCDGADCYYSLEAYADSGDGAYPGFETGDGVSFKVERADGTIVGVAPISGNVYNYPDVNSEDLNPVEIDLIYNDESLIDQVVTLRSGWNSCVSVNLIPADSTIQGIFGPILDKIAFISDDISWWQNGQGGSLTNISHEKSYYILTNEACMVTVSGSELSFPYTLALSSGWNSVSYPYANSINAFGVNGIAGFFDNSAGDIVWMKGEDGWCTPAINAGDDFILRKGRGVFIKLFNDVDLTFSAP